MRQGEDKANTKKRETTTEKKIKERKKMRQRHAVTYRSR
jgi:hypothetical protein